MEIIDCLQGKFFSGCREEGNAVFHSFRSYQCGEVMLSKRLGIGQGIVKHPVGEVPVGFLKFSDIIGEESTGVGAEDIRRIDRIVVNSEIGAERQLIRELNIRKYISEYLDVTDAVVAVISSYSKRVISIGKSSSGRACKATIFCVHRQNGFYAVRTLLGSSPESSIHPGTLS